MKFCFLFLELLLESLKIFYFIKKLIIIEELKKQTDNQIKQAFRRMTLRIQNPALEDYDGSCFVSLNESIFTAKKQAEENYNNQFSKKDTFDSCYLDMREKQTKILYEMFEAARALLFILMERLKEFLQIKHDFMIAQNNRMSLH